MDDQTMNGYLKGAVEALLFVSDKPVEIAQIKDVLPTLEASDIRQLISAIKKDYEEHERGMIIREIAGGYQLLSNPQYAEYVRNFFKTRVKEKLSRPALEALAITAYRQPVSRGDVEVIRGVNSDGVMTSLLEKGLIKIVGRKDVPGRPFVYGTTKLFLEYFGLKSLKDLPKLEDVTELLGAREAEGETSNQDGANLFGSNTAVSVEDAVKDYGGEDHLSQSFQSSEAQEMIADVQEDVPEDMGEAAEAGDGPQEAGLEESSLDAPVGSDQNDEIDSCDNAPKAAESAESGESEAPVEAAGEALEEPEDLKKVMDEMVRESDEVRLQADR